jgi:hypothetical protein
MNEMITNFGCTYTIRLSGHMESTSFELAEMLEEDSNEGSNVLCSFFSGTLVENTSTVVMSSSSKYTPQSPHG